MAAIAWVTLIAVLPLVRWSILLLSLAVISIDVVGMYLPPRYRANAEMAYLVMELAYNFSLVLLTGGPSSPFLLVFLMAPLLYGLRSGPTFALVSASLNSFILFLVGSGLPTVLTIIGIMWTLTGSTIALVKSVASQQEELAYLAKRDPLTGLLNRRSMLEGVDYLRARGTPFCVILADLDGFKDVNDTIGHLGGDEVLKKLSTAMTRALRAEDIVARYGGDEFAVLVTGTIEDAARIAERLKQTVKQIGADLGLNIGLSAGFASWPTDGDTPTRLLQVADARLYEAKEQARPSR
ncbi:MAG TPA: GGDEF domain-containing protein [Firmicutes bacterium]|nr:GGDEF domain-containing protein [Bacillota bacterium]